MLRLIVLLVVLARVAMGGVLQPAWRGVHVDVSRHFFEPRVLERVMDRMAELGYNRLHLHLTDGPGWRLEIKQYPRLIEVGAWRKLLSHSAWNWAEHEIGNHFAKLYGGFYSQKVMRGLIAYGAARGIMIVPEIDFPGHVYAALVAYPELALEPPPGCKLGRDVLAVERPVVRRFARAVLDEVMALFPPGTPIHLGGDEVDSSMLTREQQRVFMQELVDYVRAKGHPAITWDDAACNGVRGQWVMLWRAEMMDEVLALGLPTILCPNSHLYFDYPQRAEDAQPGERIISPETVRSFRIPALPHVLGVQANVWTEHIRTPEQLFYMLLPRARTLAEKFKEE